jgi:hypothetical protein
MVKTLIKVKSRVKVPHGTFIVDNIVIKPRKVKTKNGYSFIFYAGWYTYTPSRIYVDPSLVKDGLIEFPIENARAFEENDGNIHIVPYDNYVVHFLMLVSYPGLDVCIFLDGNGFSYAPFYGSDPEDAHYSGRIISVLRNSEVIVEYGFTCRDRFYEEWDSVKKTIKI